MSDKCPEHLKTVPGGWPGWSTKCHWSGCYFVTQQYVKQEYSDEAIRAHIKSEHVNKIKPFSICLKNRAYVNGQLRDLGEWVEFRVGDLVENETREYCYTVTSPHFHENPGIEYFMRDYYRFKNGQWYNIWEEKPSEPVIHSFKAKDVVLEIKGMTIPPGEKLVLNFGEDRKENGIYVAVEERNDGWQLRRKDRMLWVGNIEEKAASGDPPPSGVQQHWNYNTLPEAKREVSSPEEIDRWSEHQKPYGSPDYIGSYEPAALPDNKHPTYNASEAKREGHKGYIDSINFDLEETPKDYPRMEITSQTAADGRPRSQPCYMCGRPTDYLYCRSINDRFPCHINCANDFNKTEE